MEDLKEKQKNALGRLWRYYDLNKSKMARDLGVSQQVVNAWFSRGRISAVAAITVEEKTNGKITKQELRPDVTEWFGL
jgi:DNA-binding transcriptional regulator YdaS (Cro superfamily)